MAGKKYVVIKHKNITPKAVDIEYDANWVNNTTQALNEVIKANNIKTTSTKSFKDMLKVVSNIAPVNKIGNVSRALEEVLTGGKVSNKLIESDLLKYANAPLRNISRQMGYASFSELFNKIKYDGFGLSSTERKNLIDASKVAGEDEYTKLVVNHNKSKQDKDDTKGIEINVIESIDESYDSEVPLKRVENGFDITNAIYNKTGNISFDGFITNTSDKSVEDIKKELLDIRASKISFDIEFKEQVVGGKIMSKEPITDCFFTSISFERSNNGINGYNISFTVVPITKGIVQITKEKVVASVKTKTGEVKVGSGNKISNNKPKVTTKPTGSTNNKKTTQKQDKSTNSDKPNKAKKKSNFNPTGSPIPQALRRQ